MGNSTKRVLFPCMDYCTIIQFINYGEGDYGIEAYGTLFYEKQLSFWAMWKSRVKAAWAMLRGKEFHLYDVLTDREHLEKLKADLEYLLEETE